MRDLRDGEFEVRLAMSEDPLLSEIAREVLGNRQSVPGRPLTKTTLPGRGGFVATGWPGGAP